VRRSLLPGLFAVVSLLFAACGPPQARQYALRGQILDINRTDAVVTIRHGDIPGFMPAMVMPFKVKDRRLLEGRTRGDLVTGTLAVTGDEAYLMRLEVIGHADVVQTAQVPLADVLQPGAMVPDARLVDVDGQPFQLSSLRGSAVVLTFVYTRCPLPEFCPRMDRQFSVLLGRIRDNPRLRGTVRLLSISFDPEYDTPAVLGAHQRGVGADGTIWRFASADRQTIDAFAPRFGLVVVHEAPDDITHNLRTAIVDRQGRLVTIYDGTGWSADEVLAALLNASGT
jgi:protein SCO1